MSSLVVVSIACEADRASFVVRAAETHPQAVRPIFDEQIRRASVALDLCHLEAYPDRVREREAATSWLEHCREAREAMTWDAWCVRKGIRP